MSHTTSLGPDRPSWSNILGGWPTLQDGLDLPGGRSFAIFRRGGGFVFLSRVAHQYERRGCHAQKYPQQFDQHRLVAGKVVDPTSGNLTLSQPSVKSIVSPTFKTP